MLDDATIGASIAVNGCCLTVVELGDGWWATDVSRETLTRTVIGGLVAGDVVNLERPMALGDRLGGHLVLGHVDAVGEIVDPAPDLRVRIPPDLAPIPGREGLGHRRRHQPHRLRPRRRHVPRRGDPHTAAVTTLGHKGAGAPVNIEMDVLAKHVERLLEPRLGAA